MARKRMISPEIWASSSFAELSDFAKIVFIGLISNADDEGKGEADPALLKSTLFPRDEKKRAADVKTALSEIARSTSTLFYSVEGKNYYILTKWKVYQKLDRPTPSKIPNPPDDESAGERGNCTQNRNLDEHPTSTRRNLDEHSPLIEKNRIEMNRKEIKERNNTTHTRARARGLTILSASDDYPRGLQDKAQAEVDWQQILEKLQSDMNSLSFDVWIKPLIPVGYCDENIVLIAPTAASRDEVANRYADQILTVISEMQS